METRLRRIEKTISRLVVMDYWLYLPREYDRLEAGPTSPDRRWPLMLYLHGIGERGDLEKAKKHGPPKRIAAGAEFPFIVLVPSCPPDRWWEPEPLEVLVQEVCETYRVDEDRVYGTGLSMGGFGIWSLAIAYPWRFAAIAPICGGGTPYLVSRIAHVPVWTFHGAKDPVVPLYESQRMVDALNDAGGNARITIYPDAEHDAWTATYEKPELYEWLLSQRRRASGPARE
ncbi:MAG: prolyl oligopeptidase family serine peptidase [Planctomycetes bacterium]|nr:prolyl oligopeptidase family serine peptidase [Planctomycetota bacterium]